MLRRKFAVSAVSLLTSAALFASILTGCSQKSTADTAAASKSDQPSSSAPKKTMLHFWTYYPDQTKIDGYYMNFLKKKFNFDADFYVASPDTNKEKLNLAISSGDIPDWWKSISFQDYDKLIQQGVVAEINPQDLQTYAPHYWKFLQQMAGNDPLKYMKRNGKVYGLPEIWDLGPHSQVVAFRGDWLKKVGITKTPETLDEMETALTKFVNNDPDGNGKKDTYGISGTASSVGSLFPYVFGAFGVYPGAFTEDNGKIVRGEILPGAKDALTVLHRWYQNGLIDPEFIVNKDNNVQDKIVQEKVGADGWFWFAFAPNGAFCCNDTFVALNKKNPQATFEMIPGPKGPDGKFGMLQTNSLDGKVDIMFGKQLEKDHDKLIKYLQIFDYTSFDLEAKTAATYGEEGKTFKKNSDGTFSYIPPYDDQKERQKYGFDGAYSLPGGWNDDFSKELAAFNTKDKSMLPIRDKLINMGTGKYELLDPITKPTYNDLHERLDKLTLQTFIDIITGKKPISEFDNYVSQWKSMGGDKVMDEAQKAYDTLNKQ